MFNIYKWLESAEEANKAFKMKFWSQVYGVMTFYELNPEFNTISCKTAADMVLIFDSFGRLCDDGIVVLFPIKCKNGSLSWNEWQKSYFNVGDYIAYSKADTPIVITEIDENNATVIDEDGDSFDLDVRDYVWASEEQIKDFKESLRKQGLVYDEVNNKLMATDDDGKVYYIRKYVVGEKIKNIKTGMRTAVKSFDGNSMILENGCIVEGSEEIENEWVPDYDENDIIVLYDENDPKTIWIAVVKAIERNNKIFEIRSKYSVSFFNNEPDFENANGYDVYVFTEFTEVREATKKELQILQEAVYSSQCDISVDELESAIAKAEFNITGTSNSQSNDAELMSLLNTLTDEQKAILIDIIKGISKFNETNK